MRGIALSAVNPRVPGRAPRVSSYTRGRPPRRLRARGVALSAVNPRVPGRALRASSYTRGMTLIEILVVLVLIGVVLGIVGGNFIGKGEKAKADAAKIEISQIAQTLDLYKLEIGRYPTTQEGLQALIAAPAGVDELERSVLEALDRPQGSVGQRVQVHVAGAERAVRDRLARRRWQGGRRRAEQGSVERAAVNSRARTRSDWRRAPRVPG